MKNKKGVVNYAPNNGLGHPALEIFEYTQDAEMSKVFDCSQGKDVLRQDWHTNHKSGFNYCCHNEDMIHRVEDGFIFAPFDNKFQAEIYMAGIKDILTVMSGMFNSIVKGEKEE